MVFDLPPLNGAQLADELASGGVVLASEIAVDGDGRLVIDAPDSDRPVVQTILAAHVPDPEFGRPDEDRQLGVLRAKAREVAAGNGTFTAAQVQKILAHLVLRATR